MAWRSRLAREPEEEGADLTVLYLFACVTKDFYFLVPDERINVRTLS